MKLRTKNMCDMSDEHMYDMIDKKILNILSHGKYLEEMQCELDRYILRNIYDAYIITGVLTHLSYIKYMMSECWETFLKYLEDYDNDNNCFYYKLLSDGEKIIEIEFEEAIKKYKKLW